MAWIWMRRPTRRGLSVESAKCLFTRVRDTITCQESLAKIINDLLLYLGEGGVGLPPCVFMSKLHLSVRPFASVRLSVCPSVCLSVCPSVCSCVQVSAHLRSGSVNHLLQSSSTLILPLQPSGCRHLLGLPIPLRWLQQKRSPMSFVPKLALILHPS